MIESFDGELDNGLLKRLSQKYKHHSYKYYHKSHSAGFLSHWNHDICLSDASNQKDLSYRLDGDERVIFEYLKQKFGMDSLLRCYVNAYTFGTDANPHTDSERGNEQTFIVYLNEHWSLSWSGETVIFNESRTNIEHAFMPRFNRYITFPSNRLHAARPISRECSELRIVLVYKFNWRIS